MAADTHLMLAKNPGYLLLILASLMAVCIVPPILAEIYHEVRFVEMPQYSVALPGDSVYFSCATNLPTSLEEITWLHNGQVLNDQQDFNIDQGQLTFKISTDPLVYKSQEGSYQCIGGASGSKFKIASIAAELNIAFLGDFRGQPVNKRLEIFEGNDAVVPCQVPESIPPAFVHFLRNDDEENYDNDNAGGKILNGDTLLLQNTSMSMSGNYSCVVSNHITNQRKKSLSVVSLKVQNATGKNEKSRMIYSPKDNYEVRVGEDLHIPCTASGVPRPEIIWSKMINGVFSQVNHTNRSGVLQFTSIASNDSGHYMCAVFNGGRRYVRRTTISVVVPPQHVLVNPDVYLHVREGDSIELPCQASGSPPPFIQWRFNGQPVSGLASADVNRITGKLVILNAIADDHTGFYQCFARNKAGEVVAQAFVQVGEDILRDDKTGDNDYENLDQDLLETSFLDFQGHVVVSPTRPNVTQVNPESIIVRWELKKPEDYAQPLVPVKFFKIQFREFFRGGKGRSAWHTVEEDIDPFNRAFEIFGLHSDRKYRFRIIVVYENNDSQTSPLSRKFRLNANFANGSSNEGGGDLLSPRPKPPAKSPQILGVVPLGPTTLRLGWVLDTSANEEVEGYFIFFKPSFEEKFKKVTIIGATSHSHIIEALIPGMEYAIKVQAFNLAGASPSSKLVKESTNTLPPVKEAEVDEELTIVRDDEETKDQVEVDKDEEIVKYLIVGGSLAGTFVTLIILCYALDRCRRYKKMALPSGSGGAACPAEIHDKFNDTAVQISNHHQSFSSHLDPSSRPSLARSTQSFLTTKDSAINSNSNFEMSLLPNGYSSRDASSDHQHQGRNYSLAASDSVYSYSNSQSSLGQEYSAEPKSWRRSRKCEELTNGFI